LEIGQNMTSAHFPLNKLGAKVRSFVRSMEVISAAKTIPNRHFFTTTHYTTSILHAKLVAQKVLLRGIFIVDTAKRTLRHSNYRSSTKRIFM
jgi:uncharacterized membrane protein